MSIIIICGKIECLNFAHACRVAEHLQKTLPKFTYLLVKKTTDDAWNAWLADLNQTNEWHLSASPVIWKYLTRTGGKPYLIGGLSEFWEYIYDYYGFQSFVPRSELQDLVADHLALHVDHERGAKVIGISGASHSMTAFLIYELEQAIHLEDEELELRLYQNEADMGNENVALKLLDVVQEFVDITRNNPENIKIALSREQLIKKCDLLIILDDHSKLPSEDTEKWLTRCKVLMSFWADDINAYAKRNMKVILSQEISPACLNATVLMQSCTAIKRSNIVAVTANEGIATINAVSKKTQVPVAEMGCPPVYGMPGIASFVDVESTVTKATVFQPFERAANSKASAKLPKGHVHEELRFMSYVIDKHDAGKVRRESAIRKKREMDLLRRRPFLPTVRAISSLLKLWNAKKPDDDIISLGVCSDGSFGFPPGIVFSQPAILDPKLDVWVPFTDFPLTETAKVHIEEVLTECKKTIEPFCNKEQLDEMNCSLRLSQFRI